MAGRRQILIPLDDSAFSRKIVPHVYELFDPAHFAIILFRAARVPEEMVGLSAADMPMRPVIMAGDFMPYSLEAQPAAQASPHALYEDQAWARIEAALRDELESDMEDFQNRGYQVSLVIHFGEPAEEIVNVAKQEAVALVAMATHARTGLGKLLKGNIAEGVLHRLSVPVLLLHPEEKGA